MISHPSRKSVHKTSITRVLSRSADMSGVAATGRFGAVLLAALLGAVVLYGVAFAPVAHNVAHDTRHGIGFPCH